MAKAKKKNTIATKCTTAVKPTECNAATDGPSDVAKLTIKLPFRKPRLVEAADSERASVLSPLSDPPQSPEIMEPEADMLPVTVASALTPSRAAQANGLQATSTPRIKPVLALSLKSPQIQFINHTPVSFPRKHPQKATEDLMLIDINRPAKKPRTGGAGTSAATHKPCSADNEESEEEARNFTIHVQVHETSTAEKKSGQGSKSSTTTTVVSKGPFKFNTNLSFAKFKMQVSSTLSCDLGALPAVKFEWKFEGQPQSAPHKNLGNAAGFEALLDAIKVKCATENVVVWLYTPKPPSKLEADASVHDHDTYSLLTCSDKIQGDKAQHDGDNRGRNVLSGNKTHISGIKTMRDDAEQQIMDKYPVGNFKLFPDKRVWKDEHDNYFELTNLRIKFWANAIICGKAELSAPPTSHHFTKDKCLQVPKASTQDSDVGAIVGTANGPLPAQYYPHTMHPPAGYAPPLPPAFVYPPYYPAPYAPPPIQAVPGTILYGYHQPAGTGFLHHIPGPPPTSSPTKITHNILLDDFCVEYGISNSDKGKLRNLEYRPGHHGVERFEEREWREYGKFSRLGWETFLEAHRHFRQKIKSGL